uniref:helix-turn-helix domain-containing protein n=1 Tax=Streptococcus suis TaxID=1307 RepID=UPI001374D808
TLKEVAGDFVTPAQLSRFENGKSNLSVDTFFYCLRRMNVIEGEFSTLYQSYFQIDNLFSSEEFVRAVYSHNARYMDDRILYHQAEYDRDGRPFDRVMVA